MKEGRRFFAGKNNRCPPSMTQQDPRVDSKESLRFEVGRKQALKTCSLQKCCQTNGARVIIIVILKETHEADGPTCFTVLTGNEKVCNSV